MARSHTRKLRVAIHAQIITNGAVGGVENVLLGLLTALGELEGKNEEYIVVGAQGHSDWLLPYIAPNMHLVIPDEKWTVREP